MLKQKKQYMTSFLVLIAMVNIIFSTIIAASFDPSGGTGDDETYKDYTAKLIDIQFNTIMPLNLMPLNLLDEELEDTSLAPILLTGSVQINHMNGTETELLNNLPEVNLVNQNNEVVGTTEVYASEDSDIYYIDIYDLNINNEDQYKLLISFTDNYGNEISKYATYDGTMFISQHSRGIMTYKAMNNIAVINFNIKDIIIKGDLSGDGIVDSADAALVLNLYKYNNATVEDIQVADMDSNGILDSADAAIILNNFKYGN